MKKKITNNMLQATLDAWTNPLTESDLDVDSIFEFGVNVLRYREARNENNFQDHPSFDVEMRIRLSNEATEETMSDFILMLEQSGF